MSNLNHTYSNQENVKSKKMCIIDWNNMIFNKNKTPGLLKLCLREAKLTQNSGRVPQWFVTSLNSGI